MEIENTSASNNFSLFGFNLNFFGNTNTLTEEKKKTINDLIKISDEIYHLSNVLVKIEEKEDPRYSAKEGKIFIPLKYSENNNDIFSKLKKSLGDKFEEVVIFHEMGHVIEVDRKNNINQIDVNSHSDLNYLFQPIMLNL